MGNECGSVCVRALVRVRLYLSSMHGFVRGYERVYACVCAGGRANDKGPVGGGGRLSCGLCETPHLLPGS